MDCSGSVGIGGNSRCGGVRDRDCGFRVVVHDRDNGKVVVPGMVVSGLW